MRSTSRRCGRIDAEVQEIIRFATKARTRTRMTCTGTPTRASGRTAPSCAEIRCNGGQAPVATDEKLYRVALREALNEEWNATTASYTIGEDIGKFGGAYRVTEGLLDRFGPQRVVDAPIAEEVIVGCAIGSAMLGCVRSSS